jgi:trehalose 6-phosphate phosphatase
MRVHWRPQVDWDKGKALLHLLEALELAGKQDVVALYLGDDHTDEDAFKALKEQRAGLGILVSSKMKATDAVFTVKDPSEVQQFLTQLVEYGRSAGNGWHARGSCKGWSPAAQPQQGAPAAAAAAAGCAQQQ